MGLTSVLRRHGVRGTPRLVDKYDVHLSRETQGYTYVPLQQPPGVPALPTAAVRNNQGELYRAVRSVADLRTRQLRLRRGVSMRAIGRALSMV